MSTLKSNPPPAFAAEAAKREAEQNKIRQAIQGAQVEAAEEVEADPEPSVPEKSQEESKPSSRARATKVRKPVPPPKKAKPVKTSAPGRKPKYSDENPKCSVTLVLTEDRKEKLRDYCYYNRTSISEILSKLIDSLEV